MKEKQSFLRKAKEYVVNLENNKRGQLLAAAILTLFLIMAIPVYAWFAFSSKYESLTKVQKPNTLDIRPVRKLTFTLRKKVLYIKESCENDVFFC